MSRPPEPITHLERGARGRVRHVWGWRVFAYASRRAPGRGTGGAAFGVGADDLNLALDVFAAIRESESLSF